MSREENQDIDQNSLHVQDNQPAHNTTSVQEDNSTHRDGILVRSK